MVEPHQAQPVDDQNPFLPTDGADVAPDGSLIPQQVDVKTAAAAGLLSGIAGFFSGRWHGKRTMSRKEAFGRTFKGPKPIAKGIKKKIKKIFK